MNKRMKSTAILMALILALSIFTSLAATTAVAAATTTPTAETATPTAAATATPTTTPRAAATAAATSKVVGAATTTITITASNPNPVVNQIVTFTVTLKAGSTGLSAPIKLWYTKDGGPRIDKVGPFSTTNGVYVFSGPFGNKGTYVYHAEFAGNSTYAASSDSVTVNVFPIGTTTTMTATNTNPAVNEKIKFTVTLKAGYIGLSKPMEVMYQNYIGGKFTEVGKFNTVNGVFNFTQQLSVTGPYIYSAVFAGDSQYDSSSNAPLTVFVGTATNTTITASNPNPVVNQIVTLTVNLKAGTTGLSKPIKLWYTKDGGPRIDKVGPFSTTNGVYVFSGPFGHPGTYVYHAEFAGDSTYGPSSGAVTVNVQPIPTTTTITASKTNPAVNEKVTFTVKLKSGTTGLSAPITLWYTYNGGPRTDRPGPFSTTNGVYVFSGPFGHTGTYVYHAEFTGDSQYGASSGTVTVTVGNVKVLFFTSPLCGVCDQVKPLAQAAAAKYGVPIIIYDVSTSAGHDIATEYGITMTPTIVISGAQSTRLEGSVSQAQIEAAIQAAIGGTI